MFGTNSGASILGCSLVKGGMATLVWPLFAFDYRTIKQMKTDEENPNPGYQEPRNSLRRRACGDTPGLTQEALVGVEAVSPHTHKQTEDSGGRSPHTSQLARQSTKAAR